MICPKCHYDFNSESLSEKRRIDCLLPNKFRFFDNWKNVPKMADGLIYSYPDFSKILMKVFDEEKDIIKVLPFLPLFKQHLATIFKTSYSFAGKNTCFRDKRMMDLTHLHIGYCLAEMDAMYEKGINPLRRVWRDENSPGTLVIWGNRCRIKGLRTLHQNPKLLYILPTHFVVSILNILNSSDLSAMLEFLIAERYLCKIQEDPVIKNFFYVRFQSTADVYSLDLRDKKKVGLDLQYLKNLLTYKTEKKEKNKWKA